MYIAIFPHKIAKQVRRISRSLFWNTIRIMYLSYDFMSFRRLLCHLSSQIMAPTQPRMAYWNHPHHSAATHPTMGSGKSLLPHRIPCSKRIGLSLPRCLRWTSITTGGRLLVETCHSCSGHPSNEKAAPARLLQSSHISF